jgi:TPP-dependent pyruvate/acetoin dehydrogenase alpha subunit
MTQMAIQLEDLGEENALAYLREMVKIRAFETRVGVLFLDGQLPGFVHSCAGQEAIAVGVCSSLHLTDFVTSTHRGHGHSIAKGISLDSIFAELFGKVTGACHGRGGSMHVADFSIGMLGANGIVGGGYGIAVGAALSCKYRKTSEVVVCFFGDGALNKGTFHESLNFAGLHKLPVVFVCENNGYAQFTDMRRTTANENIASRADAYGMHGDTLDGNDLLEVIGAIKIAIVRARSGLGPTLLDMKSYRFSGHYVGDAEVYRSKDEVDLMKQKDPIERFKAKLSNSGWLDQVKFEALQSEIDQEIDLAEKFARDSAFPLPSDALKYVFSEDVSHVI